LKFRRDIPAIPVRSAEDTWAAIVALVESSESIDVDQLRVAAPVLASLITDELHDKHPIVFSGVGPRLVLYLSFGADALQADQEIQPIDWSPTAGDWTLYLPCESANLAWAREALDEKSPRITVHAPNATPESPKSEKQTGLNVDWGALQQ